RAALAHRIEAEAVHLAVGTGRARLVVDLVEHVLRRRPRVTTVPSERPRIASGSPAFPGQLALELLTMGVTRIAVARLGGAQRLEAEGLTAGLLAGPPHPVDTFLHAMKTAGHPVVAAELVTAAVRG